MTKKQVDNFKPGKGTPRCQLSVELTNRRKKISAIKHQISLQGAKFPHNVFTISLPIEGMCTCDVAMNTDCIHCYITYMYICTPAVVPTLLLIIDASAKRSQTFGDLAAAGSSISCLHNIKAVTITSIATGPPPTKKSRSESDKSAFHAANPIATPSSSAVSASLAGPSSAVVCVPKTEAATGLDAKLGMIPYYQ